MTAAGPNPGAGLLALGLVLAPAVMKLAEPAKVTVAARAPGAACPVPSASSGGAPAACGGAPLTVKFYDVGQALSALVTLPDGRRVLVDTGEQPSRPGCGEACRRWSDHLLSNLRGDLTDGRIDMLWITHQHSDHAGNAPAILREFAVGQLVDNGTNLDSGLIKRVRAAAAERSVPVRVVDPEHRELGLVESGVTLTPVLPKQWVVECEDAPNDCSIGLRIDYCYSSVLFTGDAEETEEAALEPGGPVTLLQVGHHGSDTSSSAPFIAKIAPKYAVVSSGREEEGTNTGYCHPRLSTVQALSKQLGGAQAQEVDAFDAAVTCKDPSEHAHWRRVATSDRLWFTERDGDVELVTRGDGVFRRSGTEPRRSAP